jgi:hypothetical protein
MGPLTNCACTVIERKRNTGSSTLQNKLLIIVSINNPVSGSCNVNKVYMPSLCRWLFPVICTLIFDRWSDDKLNLYFPGNQQGKKIPPFYRGYNELSDTHTFAIGSMCGFIGRQGSAAATQIKDT